MENKTSEMSLPCQFQIKSFLFQIPFHSTLKALFHQAKAVPKAVNQNDNANTTTNVGPILSVAKREGDSVSSSVLCFWLLHCLLESFWVAPQVGFRNDFNAENVQLTFLFECHCAGGWVRWVWKPILSLSTVLQPISTRIPSTARQFNVNSVKFFTFCASHFFETV